MVVTRIKNSRPLQYPRNKYYNQQLSPPVYYPPITNFNSQDSRRLQYPPITNNNPQDSRPLPYPPIEWVKQRKWSVKKKLFKGCKELGSVEEIREMKKIIQSSSDPK